MDMEQLAVQIARENPTWGYTRICSALRNLGHEIGRNTIKRILVDNGIEPASTRRRGISWGMFLKLRWGAIAAADFFTVEALTHVGLIRFIVSFDIDLKSRRVGIAGIAPEPDGRRVKQKARNLTDTEKGFRLGTRYRIHARDPLFTREFREILKSSGVEVVKLQAQSLHLSADAERIEPSGEPGHGRAVRRERLGGLLRYSNRETARDGRVVAHYEVADLILDGETSNDGRAKDIADILNNGNLVPEGMIRETWQTIPYPEEDPTIVQVRTYDYGLDAPRPSPLNPLTQIRFELEEAGPAIVQVYDSAGRFVRTLVDERCKAGEHSVEWDGLSDTGQKLPSGVYYLKLNAVRYHATRPLVLTK